jgi:hypothetical protein
MEKRTQSVRNSARAARIADCPPDVDPQTFSDWVEVRKAKRAGPVTQTALNRVRSEAGKAGISLQDAIEHCCLAGWQGFRSDWYKADKQSGRQQAVGQRPFFNKQIALEDENRRVAKEWLAQFGKQGENP